MERGENTVIVRRDADARARADRGGALLVRLLAVTVLGTIGFYASVWVNYVMAEVDMSSPETYQTMFPPREYIIAAIAAVTSAIAFLVVVKAGLYHAIVTEGVAGWIVLCPFTALAFIVIRGVAIDLAYVPIHSEEEWTPYVYTFLLSEPLQGLAYVIDGLWLFAISMLMANGAVGAPETARL